MFRTWRIRVRNPVWVRQRADVVTSLWLGIIVLHKELFNVTYVCGNNKRQISTFVFKLLHYDQVIGGFGGWVEEDGHPLPFSDQHVLNFMLCFRQCGKTKFPGLHHWWIFGVVGANASRCKPMPLRTKIFFNFILCCGNFCKNLFWCHPQLLNYPSKYWTIHHYWSSMQTLGVVLFLF